MNSEGRHEVVVVRASEHLCALKLLDVVEIMRPLPIKPIPGLPPFILGLAVVRGTAVPVVALDRLLGGTGDRLPITRFVSVRTGDKQLALAVADVVGVMDLGRAALADLPRLVACIAPAIIERVGLVDDQLLVVLSAAYLVPVPIWQTLVQPVARS